MKLSELINGIDTTIVSGSQETQILNITNDSRKAGPGTLYFAIPGARVDGAAFIKDVLAKGAAAVVTEKNPAELSQTFGIGEEDLSNAAIVTIKDARLAMGLISDTFYDHPSRSLNVIGITGTKGKTTTSYMIREMLEKAGHRTGLVGTIEILDGAKRIPAANTTPESIELHRVFREMINNGLDSVVMEVSSQGLKLNRVAGVDFDYAIFTNLSPDHIGPDEHESYEEYRECKKKLFSMTKTGIFNVDDKESAFMMAGEECRILTFGERDGSDYQADNIKIYSENGSLGVEFALGGHIEAEVKVDLPGDFSVHNSLAAIAVADEMGVDKDRIIEILSSIKVRGRVEMIPISDSFTLMIDYAHNDMSLESLLRALKAYNPKRIVTLFGCGGNRSRERRFGMGEVSGRMSDLTIITSDNPRFEAPQAIIDDIKTGISRTNGSYVEIIDRKEAIRYAILNAREGDIIILAGKGHEDYQEIEGVKHHMDERDLIREILEEEDVTKICGYNNRYFA